MMKRFAICLVAMFVCVASTLAGDIKYAITDLGNLTGNNESEATGINASGQVVGYSILDGTQHAFLYSNGSMQDLGLWAPNGINNNGQIVGSCWSGSMGCDYACVYSNGSMHSVYSTFEGSYGPGPSYGLAINASGQIVGQARGLTTGNHAFLYSNGVMQDLGTLGAIVGYGPGSCAYGVNNNGQVVGWGATNTGSDDAFLYSNGLTDLGPGTAYGINNNGQVVGNSNGNAFLYSNLILTDLGPGTAYGINNNGLIVGQNSIGDAFLYSNGSMQDLNSLIDPTLGWTLQVATGINDSGQIVGYGDNSSGKLDAFLLTPTPEPSTIALLISGLIAGGLFLRRKK
jgi:probable HAF family extracellular repeat protein